jgi:LacI family transcriptional regulator
VLNSLHPMGGAGFKLTTLALADPRVTAILYSSALMAVEGHAAVIRARGERKLTVATMDDQLHYLDLTPLAGQVSYVRSGLREAGGALIGELIRQCEQGGPPQGHLLPSSFDLAPGLDDTVLAEPLPPHRR